MKTIRFDEFILRGLRLLIVYPLSFLVPRNPACWVFGCQRNSFVENSKYLFLWINHYQRPNVNAVWISGSSEVVQNLRNHGYNAHLRWSINGLWACLRAAVYVFSTDVSDVNFCTSGRALKVNLWHGVGLKNIGFKDKKSSESSAPFWHKTMAGLRRRVYILRFIRPHKFLSTSQMMTAHFSESIHMAATQCLEADYPRLTVSKDPELLQVAKNFGGNAYLETMLGSGKYCYIYIPTWRDAGGHDLATAFPDLEKLDRILGSADSKLVIKLHPNEATPSLDDYNNIKVWPAGADLYLYLARFHGLITDYSSILYDYLAISGRDIILYNYDYDQYRSRSREFAYPYEENVCGTWVNNFELLCQELVSPNAARVAPIQSRHILSRFFEYPNRGCSFIYNSICSDLQRFTAGNVQS